MDQTSIDAVEWLADWMHGGLLEHYGGWRGEWYIFGDYAVFMYPNTNDHDIGGISNIIRIDDLVRLYNIEKVEDKDVEMEMVEKVSIPFDELIFVRRTV